MKCEKVGQKIAGLRKQNNKTQRQLAAELGVSNKAVSKWETGKGYPDIVLLPDISYVLKISIDELLDNNPFHETAKLEYMQSVETRKENNDIGFALKNAVCCGSAVLFLAIILSALYAAVSFVRIKSDYWRIAFTDALTDTMLVAIPVCLVVMAGVYLWYRSHQQPVK